MIALIKSNHARNLLSFKVNFVTRQCDGHLRKTYMYVTWLVPRLSHFVYIDLRFERRESLNNQTTINVVRVINQ